MKKMLIGGVLLLCTLSAYSTDTVMITNVDQLQDVRNHLAACYKLMNDIDLNLGIGGAGWTPIGTEADPFTGVFDGNNKTISGLWIYRPLENNIGLFGCIAGADYEVPARIENLHIKIIDGGKVYGKDNVGGLTGKNVGAQISGCSVKGEVVGYRSVSLLVGDNSTDYNTWNNAYIIGSEVEGGVTGEQNVGGLAGYNAGNIEDGSHANVKLNGVTYVGGLVGYNYGNIFKSYALGSAMSKNEAEQGEYIGGLVGSNGGTVMNCHSSVAVIGNLYTGGLAGLNFDKGYGIIKNCYSVGEVSGSPTWTGGLVGKNEGEVHGCVYDSTTAKTSKGIGYISETGAADNDVLPCSTAVMYQQATYAGWDFTNEKIWSISEGIGYPYLTGYETAPPEPPTPEPEPEPAPPPFIEITTQPSPANFSYGGTATLSVVARLSDGRGVLRYQWYQSPTAGTIGTPIEGAIFSGYPLPRLSAGTYYYCCMVSSTVATSVPSNAARIDVRQVDLRIYVANASRVYNTPNPDFPLAYSGFISGENAHSLDSLPRASCTANSLSPVGTYPITVSGGGSSNYNLIYGSGTLTVEKASVSISNFLVDTIARPITVVPKAGTGLNVSKIYHNSKLTPPDTAGTYSITIDVLGGTNYRDTTGLYVGTYTIHPTPVEDEEEEPGEEEPGGEEPGGEEPGGEEPGGEEPGGEEPGGEEEEEEEEEEEYVKPKPDPVKPKPVEPVPVDPSDPVPVEPDPDVISVWIPSISGISTLPSPGRYPVTPGTTFTLTVQTTTPLPVVVSTSRPDNSLLHIVPTTPTSLTVHILDVRESLTVSFRLDPPSSTGTAPSPRVWSTPGYLHLSSSLPRLVQIYTFSGHLLHMFPLLGTINTALPKGFYIVSTGKQQHKVFVR